MVHHIIKMTVGLCAVLLFSSSALAEDATYTLVIENDYMFNQDRDYSSGFQLDYVSPAKLGRDGLSGHVATRFLGADVQAPVRKRVGFGQLLFTPADTTGPTTPEGESPYAGFLYGTYGVLVEKSAKRLDSLHLQAGIVGPEAQGQELQEAFHSAFGDDEAQGWDTQLGTELAFALTYDQARKFPLFEIGPLQSEVIGHFGGSVGTLLTQAHAGANVRLGFDLADDYGPIMLFPFVSAGQWDNKSIGSGYIYAGFEGRAVARNLFLDGSTFEDSPSVDKEPLVTDLVAGAVVQAWIGQISFTYQERGKQYETQETPHKVGSVNFSLGL